MNYIFINKQLRNILLFTGVFLLCLKVEAQSIAGDNPGPISSHIPSIIQPSPTVASLMKFEEIPVNNYTGIPDITIPLYSVTSLSSDISVDIALKYHPSSIAVKETASYTGLGWNLTGGGVISRTVRGTPDEIITPGGVNNTSKLRSGIYCKNAFPTHANHYYQVLDIINSPLPSAPEIEMLNEFLWRSFEKGILDNEHDLYQYNFMGHSGRFIIKMLWPGNLKIVKLDNDNSLKIELDYSYSSSPETYTFNKFIIYDDKGYKYIFDIKETTQESRAVESKLFGGALNESFYHPVDYVSSFHLSAIYDNNSNNETSTNDKPIVKYFFQNSEEIIETQDFMSNRTLPQIEAGLALLHQNFLKNYYVHGLLPKSSFTVSRNNIQTKKIERIEILNKAKIYFVLESGRKDILKGDLLKQIIIKDWYNTEIKRYILHYIYPTVISYQKRLTLAEVQERNPINESLSHKLYYENKSVKQFKTDYWGYAHNNFNAYNRNTDPVNCTDHILQKISLPTGGCIIFDFESNTYSYIGDEEVIDFSESPDNYDNQELPINLIIPIGDDSHHFGYVAPLNGSSVQFDILADVPGGWLTVTNDSTNEELTFTCVGQGFLGEESYITQEVQLEANARYTFTYYRPEGSTERINVTLNGYIRNFTSKQKQLLYGGGNRIKTIGYFDVDVPQNYYRNPVPGAPLPAKQKNYNYNFFGSERSSGSLVFAKPVFEYVSENKMWLEPYDALNPCDLRGYTYPYLSFNTTVEQNTLLAVRTHGSDVGYKNVTVWETDNGKSEYTYTSPIDYPEQDYTITYPFLPSKNIDYKRGALEKEKHYRQSDMKVISQTEYFYYDYDGYEGEEQTGIKVFGVSCPAAFKFATYANFYNAILYTPGSIPSCNFTWADICALPGYGHNYIGYNQNIKQAYGWRRLSSKVTTNYFYEGITQKNVQTTETYKYDDNNKKLSEHTITNSLGETIKTNYFFDSNHANRNRIGVIKKTETIRNSILLETKQINYANNWPGNNSYLPQSVLVSKTNNALEPRIQYLKYDEYSNPLEVKQENGIHIVYLWGYHNAYPVAKIENMEYSQIPANLITAIQTASNNNNEVALLTALTNLRNHSALTNAMVTTYTYKPLVGISTITDPRGYKTTYQYDNFGRLKFVRDADGNILEEHQYHYRP